MELGRQGGRLSEGRLPLFDRKRARSGSGSIPHATLLISKRGLFVWIKKQKLKKSKNSKNLYLRAWEDVIASTQTLRETLES